MAADDFNENDQVDLDSDVESASEAPDAAALDAAYEKFFSKATKSDLEEAGVDPKEVAAEQEKSRINSKKAALRKAEQKQELREEGLEADDELDEEAEANGEEEAPAIKDKAEVPAEEATEEAVEEAPVLDPALRYAAAAVLGWSDEKIDKLFKADPELATETIQSLTEQYTNLSRQLLTNPASLPQAGTQQVVATPAQPAAPASKLDEIYANMAAFAETNGEELAEMFKALKAEIIDPFRAEQAKLEAQKAELSKTEARQTFGGLSTKFASLYGEQGKPRNPEQQKAVAELAEVADQLRAGAKQRGQDLSISDAINRAHLLVSHNHREQVVRKSIKEQVQTRAKGISARPTNRRDPLVTSSKSREAAADALTRKAAELGIQGFDE